MGRGHTAVDHATFDKYQHKLHIHTPTSPILHMTMKNLEGMKCLTMQKEPG